MIHKQISHSTEIKVNKKQTSKRASRKQTKSKQKSISATTNHADRSKVPDRG
jgi:hypothetical protein